MAVAGPSFQVLPGNLIDFDRDEGINVLTFTSRDETTTTFVSTFRPFGEIEDATLEIGSAEDGGGQDSFTSFLRDVEDTHFLGNEADNAVRFFRDVDDSNIELGGGADRVAFFGDVEDTTIDLGEDDGEVDEIFIRRFADVDNLTITGADDGDLLIIGGQEFTFDFAKGGFVDDDGDLFEDDDIKYLDE